MVVLALLAHLASVGAGWIWDDDSYVTENPILLSSSGLIELWIPGRTPQFYPLVFLGFWIEHAIVGDQPFLYHLVNVVLHATNAALLFLVLRRVGVAHAVWIAALFAVHPMGVESVAWVTERKNVLSMAFALASTLAFLRHLDATDSTRARWWSLAFAAFVAALLSKTTAIFVPPCLVLIALWQRRPIGRALVASAAPFFVVGAALGLVTASLEKTHVGASGAEFALGALERLQLAGRTAAFYVVRFAWPSEQVFIYPRFTIEVGSVVGWLPTCTGAAILALGAARWRRGRGLLLGTLWYGASLFPALGFFDVWPFRYSYVADHFAYAAMPCLSLAVVAAASGCLRSARAPTAMGRVLGALALVACIGLANAAIPKYESKETLWRATADANHGAWIAHSNIAREHLGKAEAAIGRGDAGAVARHAEDARASAARAVEIAPAELVALMNLGEALRLLGRNDEALAFVARAVETNPQLAEPVWAQARLLEALGRVDEARAAYRAAADHRVDRSGELAARRELFRIAHRAGEIEDARREAERIVALDPADGGMLANLGALEVARGDPRKGRAILRRAATEPLRFASADEWSAAAARYLGLYVRATDAELRGARSTQGRGSGTGGRSGDGIRADDGAARDDVIDDRASGDESTSEAASEAIDAQRVAEALARLAPGDPGVRFLALAVRDRLGDAAARSAIEALEREAREAGATEFADEVRRHLDARGATGVR